MNYTTFTDQDFADCEVFMELLEEAAPRLRMMKWELTIDGTIRSTGDYCPLCAYTYLIKPHVYKCAWSWSLMHSLGMPPDEAKKALPIAEAADGHELSDPRMLALHKRLKALLGVA